MNLGIVIPVFNDWLACRHLLDQLAVQLGAVDAPTALRTTIFVVDDGSTAPMPPESLNVPELEVRLVELVCNVGNQRAIAIGLCVAQQEPGLDAVAVMDGDGEDRPEDLVKLVQWMADPLRDPGAIAVARRDSRSEGLIFRLWYRAYRAAFHALTGQTIRFGNFCIIPRSALDRLVYMPDIWNNLAASIHRSRFRLHLVHSNRGERYAGRASTTLTSLIVHGLSSVSVYSDVVFVRGLLFSVAVGSFALIGIVAALYLKLFTDLATPGWTTTVVGSLAIIALQLVMSLVAASFLLLSSRTHAVTVPAMRAAEYVRATQILSPGPAAQTRPAPRAAAESRA